MEWVETTGRTVEDAKEAALDELGVDAEDAEFEVLEEPKQGLFGRLRSEGRVRARVRPVAPPAKDDRRRRGRSRSGGDGQGHRSGGDSATPEAQEVPTPAEGTEAVPAAATDEAPGETTAAASAEGEGEAAADGPSRSRSRRGRGRSGAADANGAAGPAGDTTPSTSDDETSDGGAPSEDVGAGAPAARAGGGRGRGGRSAGRNAGGRQRHNNDEEGTDVDVALDEQAAVATEFLQGLVNEFGLTADIASHQPGDEVLELNLTGSDLGLLIGPKGSTLLAIQDLTRTVVQRKTGAGNGRIHVDVGGYRQKRAEALSRFALQIADEVKRSGVRKALEPMSAPDRKVVHDALTDVDGVTTMSEGEDARRRVVISPSS